MAKDKAGKKGAKGAGVTRSLRKAGTAASDLARQPVVGEFVAAALTAAAQSLVKDNEAGKANGRAAPNSGGPGASDVSGVGAAVGAAVKKALLDAARQLLDNLEEAGADKAPAQGGAGKSGTGKSGAGKGGRKARA